MVNASPWMAMLVRGVAARAMPPNPANSNGAPITLIVARRSILPRPSLRAVGVLGIIVLHGRAAIKRQPRVHLSRRPAGAVEAARQRQHHIARLADDQAFAFDFVSDLAFQDE